MPKYDAKDFGKASGMGFTIVIFVFAGLFLGAWLDRKFNTQYIFVIAGLFLGCFSAGWSVYKMVKLQDKDIEDDENEPRKE